MMLFAKTCRANKFLLTIILALVVNGAHAQVEVWSFADKRKILIGEHIKLRIETRIPENLPVKFPVWDSLPHFEIVESGKIDTSSSGQAIVMIQEVTLTSFDSGSWHIPPFHITIDDKIYRSDSISVEVGYVPFDESGEYNDIVDVKAVSDPWQYVLYALGIIAVLVLIWALWYLVKNRGKKTTAGSFPHLSPFDEAMKMLDILKEESPPAKEKYTRLIDIFRVYLKRQLKIDTTEKTAAELVIVINADDFSRDQYTAIAQVMRMSDMVKFAKYIPGTEEDKESIETVRNVIQTLNSPK